MLKLIIITGVAMSYVFCFKTICRSKECETSSSSTTDFFGKIGFRETILGRFLPPTDNPLYENCKCSAAYNPVCGSNNKSYYNPCYLTCGISNTTVEIKHYGKCLPF